MRVTPSEHQQSTERLWTPWRGAYVGGRAKEGGCIFCNRLERSSDVESLILYRAAQSFVIMNLFPYNTGHIMLVPNQHAPDPSGLTDEALAEMGTMLPTLTNALRRAFACHGFNVGLNIGATAGAGVEAHLHQHIVPRWQGDANFMPIIASTMTIPELIPVTYAKIRAELIRELTGTGSATFILFEKGTDRFLLRNGAIPSVALRDGEAVVTSMIDSLPGGIGDAVLAGWAGPNEASAPDATDIVLTLSGVVSDTLPNGWQAVSYDDAIDPEVRAIINRAIRQRAPWQ